MNSNRALSLYRRGEGRATRKRERVSRHLDFTRDFTLPRGQFPISTSSISIEHIGRRKSNAEERERVSRHLDFTRDCTRDFTLPRGQFPISTSSIPIEHIGRRKIHAEERERVSRHLDFTRDCTRDFTSKPALGLYS